MKVHELFVSEEAQLELRESLDRILPYKLIKTEEQEVIGKWFRIECEPVVEVAIQSLIFKHERIGEVSFYTDEKKFKAVNVFTSGKVGSIIATVIDICEKEEDVETWFFSAKFNEANSQKEFDKRTSLYMRVSQRYARKKNMFFKTFTTQGDRVYIVSNYQITEPKILNYAKMYS